MIEKEYNNKGQQNVMENNDDECSKIINNNTL